MLNVMDVANFLIYLMPEEENELTNLKLNKLMYFAQGHSLQRNNIPLFHEDIQAWKHGPVIPQVYHNFKAYKNAPITRLCGEFDISKFNDDEKELLVDVAREYGQYTGKTLRSMTHKAGTPWSQVYNPQDRNIVISQDAIKQYFDKQPDIQIKDIEFADDEFVGYRDENGYLVLPKELDD